MTTPVYGIKKVASHPLRRQAYQQIKDLIVHNKLRPNEEIVIDQLAAELGMSHTPVREALIRLELDGLIKMERHRTPRVSEIRMEDIRDMYQVRVLLEGWGAAQAALNLGDAQLTEIADLLERARAEARGHRYDIHLTSDLAFHDSLIRAVPNALFRRLANTVADQTLRLRSLVQTVATQHIEQILSEHYAVLEALRARQPELARQRMVSHLEAAMLRTLETCEREASGVLQPQRG